MNLRKLLIVVGSALIISSLNHASSINEDMVKSRQHFLATATSAGVDKNDFCLSSQQTYYDGPSRDELLESNIFKTEFEKRTQGFDLSKAFVMHRLPKDKDELIFILKAVDIGESLLKKGCGMEALKYLLYAEGFWEPRTIGYLYEVSIGTHLHIPTSMRQQIGQEIQAMIPRQGTLQDVYNYYTNTFSQHQANLISGVSTSSFAKLTKSMTHYISIGISYLD